MTNEAQYLELMSKYLSGNINPAERKQLLGWAEESPTNQAFFDEIIQLWSISDAYSAPNFEVDEEKAWARLSSRLNLGNKFDEQNNPLPGDDQPVRIRSMASKKENNNSSTSIKSLPVKRRPWRRIAAVAAILLMSTLAFYQVFMPQPHREVITEAGERTEVLLPDGTKVVLNQNSSLAYRTQFKPRSLQLEGEGYFEVAPMPDRPFSITSGKVTTTVLGTAFNVRAYPIEDEIEVVVLEGRVQVGAGRERLGQASVILNAGEAIRYDKSRQVLEETSVDAEDVLLWKSSSLDFKEEPFTDIVYQLERYFRVEIELSDEKYKNCPFTINKMVRPSLEEMFLILEGLDFKIEKLGSRHYRITGGMCE